MGRKRRLFLVDGSALAYRAYFAFVKNPLITSKGENTSAVFGFTNAILRLLREEQPDYFAVVFDAGAPTFRHLEFAPYKATRQKMPQEMREQLVRVREVIEALRLPILEVEGFEADDVMGALAKRAKNRRLEVVLVTGDKDFLQLVDDSVKVLYPHRGGRGQMELIDEEKVKEKFGVEPARVPDVLGLMGDASDNVPGVPGVGEKTAVQLVQKYGSLEEVLAHAQQLRRKNLQENLIRYANQARLSKQLVTIRTDAPIEVDIESLAIQEPDSERLMALFKELEFSSLLKEFVPQEPMTEKVYSVIRDVTELDQLISHIRQVGYLALDLETTNTDPMRAKLVGISLAVQPYHAFYIPVGHLSGPNLDLNLVLSKLKPVLEDGQIRLCGQNIKYDLIVLARLGTQLKGMDFDTMVASYLLNPSARQHSLEALSLEYLGYRMTPISELIGKGKGQISMAEVPVERVKDYACEDVDIALQLRNLFKSKLEEMELMGLFREVEIPLISVLADMEMTGVAIDVGFLAEMSHGLDEELKKLVAEIYELAGEEFNINSTKQLRRILFEKLKLPVSRRTKTGYSTDVEVLEELAKKHELPRKLLDYRQLMKLKSTYVDAIPRLVHPETGRIHTSYNQTVTATGRLSSSDPNLQNIPIRTELGRAIRKAFIPQDEGWVILSADYSQVELRIMAHLSQDPILIDSFLKEEDVHTRTAALVFGVCQSAVTPDLRRQAKVVNFGIMYGMGPYGLASQLGISPQEAGRFIAEYFERYPGVRDYTFRIVREAREKGYVTTLLNRRRYLPEINSDNRMKREFAERMAINTPIQGTAADLIKVAMIRIHRKLKEMGLETRMILQVHDELVFEVPKGELERVPDLIREEMEGALKLSVPIKVDIGIGQNWYEAH